MHGQGSNIRKGVRPKLFWSYHLRRRQRRLHKPLLRVREPEQVPELVRDEAPENPTHVHGRTMNPPRHLLNVDRGERAAPLCVTADVTRDGWLASDETHRHDFIGLRLSDAALRGLAWAGLPRDREAKARQEVRRRVLRPLVEGAGIVVHENDLPTCDMNRERGGVFCRRIQRAHQSCWQ
jgi:hypothetical protein